MDSFTEAMEAHRGSRFTRTHKLLVAAAFVVTAALSGVTGAAIARGETNEYPSPSEAYCATEDSPSCWWEDPDTGAFYWNGPEER